MLINICNYNLQLIFDQFLVINLQRKGGFVSVETPIVFGTLLEREFYVDQQDPQLTLVCFWVIDL